MNDIKYNCPCISFAFLIQKPKIDGVEHDRECFEEDQNQHQVVKFEYLNLLIIKYFKKICNRIVPLDIELTVWSFCRKTASQINVARKNSTAQNP